MNISMKTRNLDLDQKEKELMVRRLEGLQKFFSSDVFVDLMVEKTRGDLKGDDLYNTAIKIDDGPGRIYFAEEAEGEVMKSFNHAYREIQRVVRKDRSKARALFRSAGRKVKQFLLRGKKR